MHPRLAASPCGLARCSLYTVRSRKMAPSSRKLRDSSVAHEPDLIVVADTWCKSCWQLVPRAVMAVKHTTTIRANITDSYSTAVGPSSCHKNSTTAFTTKRIPPLLNHFAVGLPQRRSQELTAAFNATLEKVLLALDPRAVMATIQTTTMRQSEHHRVLDCGRPVFLLQEARPPLNQADSYENSFLSGFWPQRATHPDRTSAPLKEALASTQLGERGFFSRRAFSVDHSSLR